MAQPYTIEQVAAMLGVDPEDVPPDLLPSGMAGHIPGSTPPPAPAPPPEMPPPTAAPTGGTVGQGVAQPDWMQPQPFTPKPPPARPQAESHMPHKVAGALFAGLTGGQHDAGYGDRLGREAGQRDRQYADDTKAHAASEKERYLDSPIDPALAAKLELDPKMTNRVLEQWRQSGGGKMSMATARNNNRLDVLEGKGKNKAAEIDQQAGHTKKEIDQQGWWDEHLLRIKGNKLGTGSGRGNSTEGRIAGVPGLRELIDRYVRGEKGPDVNDLPLKIRDALGRKDAQFYMQKLDKDRGRADIRTSQRGSRWAKFGKDSAGVGTSLYDLQAVVGSNSDVNEQLEELAGSGGVLGVGVGEGAKALQNKLRTLATNFINMKGGKQITESEQKLIMGALTGIIAPNSIENGFLRTFVSAARRAPATAQDVRHFMAHVAKEHAKMASAAAEGSEGPTRLYKTGFKKMGANMVIDQYAEVNGVSPDGIRAKPSPGANNEWVIRNAAGEVLPNVYVFRSGN